MAFSEEHTPVISSITLPSNSTYYFKDTDARSEIESIQSQLGIATGAKALIFRGVSSTPLVDGEANAPTVNGTPVGVNTLQIGDIYFYDDAEYIWGANPNTSAGQPSFVWHELGRLSGLGGLAYVSTATGSYTPAGTINAPSASFSGTTATITVSTTGVPGSVNVTTTSAKYIVTGELSTDNATFYPTGKVTSTTFTGKTATISVSTSYTPSATVTLTTENTNVNVTATSSASGNYTPSGTISTPTISKKTAGSTTTINNPASKSVVGTVTTAAPNATAMTGELSYCFVENETLSLRKIGRTMTDSITGTTVTVKTGDAVYESDQPTFTGEKVQLRTSTFTLPTSVTYTPNAATISMETSYTPEGTNSSATFQGDGVRLETEDITTPTQITFSGSALTMSTSYRPAGSVTVEAPTFTGTAGTVTVHPAS